MRIILRAGCLKLVALAPINAKEKISGNSNEFSLYAHKEGKVSER